jgi:tetratricopeptide (TPR) repeat protein
LVGEGRRWTARTLEAAPEAPKTLRATALNRCALLARLEGDAESAAQLLGASLDSFRELDDEEGIARVAGNLGLLRYDCGDDLGAVAALSECIALNRRHGKHPDVPFFQLNLGMVYTRLKRYAEAEAAFAEAHANWQAAGDQVGTSTTILNMAHLARDQQQFERAAGLYLSGLRISVAIGDRPLLSAGLEGISHVLLRRAGDARDKTRLKLCVQILACAAGLRESTGVAVHAANFPQYQADLKRLRAILGTKAFEAEWTRGWDAPVETLVVQLSGLQRK